jgi:septal ring factor EnvC (AmiA/AmiB activator)
MADKLNDMLTALETELRDKHAQLRAAEQQLAAVQATYRDVSAKLAKTQAEWIDKERRIAEMNVSVAELMKVLEPVMAPVGLGD